MYKKFTQNAIDEVKDKILSGDFNYYYGGEGSDLDDDYYSSNSDEGECDEDVDDDGFVEIDDIDVDDYDKVTKFYRNYYLAESTDKKYNILDSEDMFMLLDEDAPFINKLNNRGLIIIGNDHIDHDSVIDFKLKRPNYMFDLETLTYPMGLDWFIISKISNRMLLLSDSNKFILFDMISKRVVSKEYDSIQRIINDVYVSTIKMSDNTESYSLMDADNECLIDLTAGCSLKHLKGIKVSAETEFVINDDDGNSYQIKLDEGKNYTISKL